MPLPATPYEACDKRTGRVSSLSLVRYRGNDYSAPVCWGHREVLVKGYVHEVVISCGAEVIARHSRSYEREDMMFDPVICTIWRCWSRRRMRSIRRRRWWAGSCRKSSPNCGRLLEARLSKRGKREYVQVLRLLETFSMAEVTKAVEDALRLRAISFSGIMKVFSPSSSEGGSLAKERPWGLNVTGYLYDSPGLTPQVGFSAPTPASRTSCGG